MTYIDTSIHNLRALGAALQRQDLDLAAFAHGMTPHQYSEARRKACAELAAALSKIAPAAAVPRRQRKPSTRTLIEQAKAAGATAVTLPDGTKFDFGKPEPTEATNPWLADLHKVKQQ
jgi:hypothetical protein